MAAFLNILTPVDRSPCSAHAVGLAAAFARKLDGRLTALYVADPTLGPDREPPEEVEGFVRQAMAEGGSADVIRRTGDPVGEILQVSRTVPTDLIVMGTHGRKGLARALLGSVAEEVVRRAEVPVVTVREPLSAERAPGAPIRSIAVATDLSDLAGEATAFAAELALAADASLHLVTVDTSAEAEAEARRGEHTERAEDWDRSASDATWAQLEAVRHELRETYEGLPVQAHIRVGDPAEALAQFAKAFGVDLIVVGSHGRRGVRRVLFGSVSEEVMRTAPCPVVTVHAGQAARV